MQINHALQFQTLEDDVAALVEHIPDLPATELLVCRMVLSLGRDLSARLENQIRPHGLTEAEFRVLMSLFSRPDGTAHSSDLSLAASQSAANMSRISDALVGRKLVTRDGSAQDRRRMVLRITAPGTALVQRLLPTMLLPLRRFLHGFPEAEQVQMIAQLRRLGAALDEVPA